MKIRRKIQIINIKKKKTVTKIKHLATELTKTKSICTDLKLGNGVSTETNELFDFLTAIRIFFK